MRTVTTVLGPLDAGALGRVDTHEHVFLRSPILPGDEFEDLELMCEEVTHVRNSGIDTIIDLTPIGLGRAPLKTAQLSRRTLVNIVVATGVHRRAHYPNGHWVYSVSEEELTELMVTDLETGIDNRDWQGPRPQPTNVCAGIIKLGASYHAIHASEQRWFSAGAAAAARTGVPIAVHTEVGTAAHEVLDALEGLGVPANEVMLAHLDRNIDPALHAEIADRGAFLGYDTIGRAKYHSDAAILDLIAAVVELGHASQILLGTDVGRSSTLLAYGGGPGMSVLGRTFAPRLSQLLGADLEEAVLVENPRRYLTGG
jgi:predicted metal-dependent phosphotriesterase family hydrolase